MRAEVDVNTESSRGVRLRREEKWVTEDMDTRASVLFPHGRPQSRFLMGEARPGNRRGVLHGGTERESRGTGLGAMGWWMKGGGGTRGGP